MVSIAGIALNLVMVVLIIVIVILAISFNSQLNNCLNRESPFCYQISCPCDGGSNATGPCFGASYRPGPADRPNTWYCSTAPLTLVDNNGTIV